MDKSTVIRMKKKLSVTDLAGEKVMIDFESGKYFMIKGSGNDIWDMIQDEITVGEIVDRLLDIYDVDEAVCESSVTGFLDKMRELGFIE